MYTFRLNLKFHLLKFININRSAQYFLFIVFELFVFYSNAQQLLTDTITTKEVEVTESKIPKYVLGSPITLIKVDSRKLKEFPGENYYAGLATQKGVGVITNGLFNKVLNLRGFSAGATWNEGMLELVDGMDINTPGMGFSFGNLTGTNDIDVDNVELIPGAASAIYGANAFNGLILTTTKDPFRYQGLTVQLKSGINYLDGKYHDPALFNDYQIRYAKAFKNKFAIKINLGYLNGTEWMKTIETDFDPNATDEIRGINNPGRDLANIYGDEIQQAIPIGTGGTLVNVSRTGWNNQNLSQLKTRNIKADGTIYYHLSPETEVSYNMRYRIFNTDFGEQSWCFRNFAVTYHKLELKNESYFIRAYHVKDHDGNSYDGAWVAQLMNPAWKSDSIWFNQYANAYNGQVTGVTGLNHQEARSYADQGMPQPGSEQFNKLFNEFKSKPIGQGGARNIDESSLAKVLGQYNFNKIIPWAQIIAGFELGWRKIFSEGTQEMDYPPPFTPIHDNNISGYVQVTKYLFHEKLNLTASLRADKYSQFDLHLTPRFAVAYQVKQNNFIRASVQSGTQNPDPYFLYGYSPEGDYQVLGGSKLTADHGGLPIRSFEFNSIQNYLDHANAYLLQYGQDSIAAAVELYKHLLKPSGFTYLQPQKLNMFELGYQTLLANKKIHFDINIYFTIYRNMLGATEVDVPSSGNPFDDDSINAAAYSFLNYDYKRISTGMNAKKNILAGGTEAGAKFNFYKSYFLSVNFTYQNENLNPDFELWVPLVHSPKYKSNVSLSNENVYKNVGFAVNWRWTDAVPQNVNDNNPHINNNLSAKSVIDAQLSYSLSKLKTVFRVGSSNLLNHYYLESANGPSIGGVYYFSIVYNVN